MTAFSERAPAKINLTLSILGRRRDGYHALQSLVAFAGAADLLTLHTNRPRALLVTGPFASAIVGENLLDRTLDLLSATEPGLVLGAVTLEKNLPVAAGIGGGSADAAALLRAVRRANPHYADRLDWPALARQIGADVPVCLAGRAAWMCGTGERLHALAAPLPPLSAVLVNPQAPVPAGKTARVFSLLDAKPVSDEDAAPDTGLAPIADASDLTRLLSRSGNDLEGPALAAVPELAAVLEALRTCPGARFARLSGAGPTCYAIFPDENAATSAATSLAASHPGWWIAATTIA